MATPADPRKAYVAPPPLTYETFLRNLQPGIIAPTRQQWAAGVGIPVSGSGVVRHNPRDRLAWSQDYRRGDRTAFGLDFGGFDSDGVGKQVLGIMNARDQARKTSAELSARVFGSPGDGTDIDGSAGSLDDNDGPPAVGRGGVLPEQAASPATPRSSARVAALPAGTRYRVRPNTTTIAGGA